jgi:type II secretory pathway predicted ATPase ExeA
MNMPPKKCTLTADNSALIPRKWCIFSDQAISEIFRYSAGSARLINKACTHCLMYGSQQNKKILDDALARYVIEQELV